jgi:hypothetical protein
MNQITIAMSASLGAQPMEISSMKHAMVTSNTRAKKWTKSYHFKDSGLLQQNLLIQLSFVAIK